MKKDITHENKYSFEPQEDITAYELAFVFSHAGLGPFSSLHKSGLIITPEQWETIPKNVKRHFRKFVE